MLKDPARIRSEAHKHHLAKAYRCRNWCQCHTLFFHVLAFAAAKQSSICTVTMSSKASALSQNGYRHIISCLPLRTLIYTNNHIQHTVQCHIRVCPSGKVPLGLGAHESGTHDFGKHFRAIGGPLLSDLLHKIITLPFSGSCKTKLATRGNAIRSEAHASSLTNYKELPTRKSPSYDSTSGSCSMQQEILQQPNVW